MSSRNSTFKICTYNIHKGFCALNLREILAQLRQAIRAQSADIVCLQEVVGNRLRRMPVINSVEASQFEYLADEVWPHHAYGKNAVYQRGHHGNAILSKYPMLEWVNRDVSRWWFSQRGILSCRLQNEVYVFCIHMGLLERERQHQLEILLDVISNEIPADAPLIVAGDFNDWTAKSHRLIQKTHLQEAFTTIYGRPAKTYPARLPLFSMDRIYFRNLSLIDANVLVGASWRRLSDHRALTATFSLATA